MLLALVVAAQTPVLALALAALAALAVFGQVVVAGDAAAADAGGTPEPGDASPAADPEPAAATAAAGTDDDDDPDAVEDDDSDLPANVREHPRYKTNANKLRRIQRWKAKNSGLVERVRALGGTEALDRLLQRSAQAESIERQLQSSPKLRALLNGEPDDTTSATSRAPAAPARRRHVDDLEAFDQDHPATPVMRRMAETLDRLEDENARLRQDVTGVTSKDQQREQQTEQAAWKSAVDAAAEKLSPQLRTMFTDAVAGAFQHAKRNGLKVTPQQVIDHYLKDVGVSKPTAAAASAAAASRIATHNKNQPSRSAVTGGSPAAAGQRTRETVEQLGRRLRAEARAGTR